MIEQIEITGFRCFEKASLSKLRRLNLVVGRNASGKTALLEAIFLASVEGIERVLQFRSRRGLGEQVQVGLNRDSYEALWRDLFFGHDQDRPIYISLRGSPSNTRSVAIAYAEQSSRLPLGEVPIAATPIVPIEFVWKGADDTSHSRRAELTERGLNFGAPVPTFGHLVAFFSPGHKATAAESANWFSDLSKKNQESPVIDALREEFPYVDTLTLETYYGQPMIFAQVRGLREKMPLGMVSDGVSRVLNFLLGIATRPHGILLVDEIENGLHYERLRGVWSLLLRFCKSNDVQLFATTHSHECLRALGDVVKDQPEEVCLIRATREDGKCTLRSFLGLDLFAAVEQGLEVRH